MPLLSCDPLVLVGAVGSIEGVRSQLLRRGCSAVVSETVGTPFPSRKHRIRQCHCNAVPQRANWVGGSDSRAQGTDAEHTIVADHPASRITVTTSTNPQGTQIVSVTAPHSPLVAGHAPTIPTPTKGEWWPLLTPQCTTGGRLRVIHSITKVLLSLAPTVPIVHPTAMGPLFLLWVQLLQHPRADRPTLSSLGKEGQRDPLLTCPPFCKGRRL